MIMKLVLNGSNILQGTSPLPLPGPKTICVFCGARSGNDESFIDAATELGDAIGLEGMALLYGGGAEGLMGAVARAAAEHGSLVTAVMPRFLADRIPMLAAPHEMVIVPDMHTRKRIMFERADAFVALPGGIGTIEELTEIVTLHKLEQQRKPLVFANIKGFWEPLLQLFSHLERSGFISDDLMSKCLVAETPSAILPMLRGFSADAAEHAANAVSPAWRRGNSWKRH